MQRSERDWVKGMAPVSWGEFTPLPENSTAVRAARRLARCLCRGRAAVEPHLLYLHGPPGTGKSLLAQTLVDQVAKSSDRTAFILPARELFSEPAHNRQLQGCDLLVIEDLHHLRVNHAEQLCQLLDWRTNTRRPTVITAATGPAQLSRLSRRLTSRCASGLVLRMNPIGRKSRQLVIERWAKAHRLHFEADAIDWLIDQTGPGGLRALLGRLEQIHHLAPQAWSYDQARLRRIFADDPGQSPDSLKQILHRVSTLYEVSPNELVGPRRMRTVTEARHVAMYLARQLTGASLPSIGRFFGGRDHATVLHACRAVEAALPKNLRMSQTVRDVIAELR